MHREVRRVDYSAGELISRYEGGAMTDSEEMGYVDGDAGRGRFGAGLHL